MTLTPTRALTIWEPWASAIVHGDKRIENRTWRPPRTILDEVIAIHAGKTFDQEALNELVEAGMIDGLMTDETFEYHAGHIIGVARVIGWGDDSDHRHRIERPGPWLDFQGVCERDGSEWYPDAVIEHAHESPWWMGPVGWLLGDIAPLETPIPARGMPGVWKIPEDVRERMEVTNDI